MPKDDLVSKVEKALDEVVIKFQNKINYNSIQEEKNRADLIKIQEKTWKKIGEKKSIPTYNPLDLQKKLFREQRYSHNLLPGRDITYIN